MYGGDWDWMGAIIIFGIVCAVAGWGIIELIIWLFSFVHISFGG